MSSLTTNKRAYTKSKSIVHVEYTCTCLLYKPTLLSVRTLDTNVTLSDA